MQFAASLILFLCNGVRAYDGNIEDSLQKQPGDENKNPQSVQPVGLLETDNKDLIESVLFDIQKTLSLIEPATDFGQFATSLVSCAVGLVSMHSKDPPPSNDMSSPLGRIKPLLFPSLSDVRSCLNLNDQNKLLHPGPVVKFCYLKIRDSSSIDEFIPGAHRGPETPRSAFSRPSLETGNADSEHATEPSVSSSEQNTLKGERPLRVSTAISLCLPDSCSAAQFELAASLICKLHSCADVFEDNMIVQVCGVIQSMLCGSRDRETLGKKLHLECHTTHSGYGADEERDRGQGVYNDDDKTDDVVSDILSDPQDDSERRLGHLIRSVLDESVDKLDSDDVQNVKHLINQMLDEEFETDDEDDSSGQLSDISDDLSIQVLVSDLWKIINPVMNRFLDPFLQPWFTPSADSLVETELSLETLESLSACGSQTFSDPSLIMASGTFQDLGDYKTCMAKSADATPIPGIFTTGWRPACRYCSLHYLAMLTSGRCLPTDCDEGRLGTYIRTICDMTGGGTSEDHTIVDGSGRSVKVKSLGSTCLDFVSIIPLDLCLMINLFGCPMSNPMAFMEAKSMEELLDVSLFRKDQNGTFNSMHAKSDMHRTPSPNEAERLSARIALDAHNSLASSVPQMVRSFDHRFNSFYSSAKKELAISDSSDWTRWTSHKNYPFSSPQRNETADSYAKAFQNLGSNSNRSTNHVGAINIYCQSEPEQPSWFSIFGFLFSATLLKFCVTLPIFGWLATTSGMSWIKWLIVQEFGDHKKSKKGTKKTVEGWPVATRLTVQIIEVQEPLVKDDCINSGDNSLTTSLLYKDESSLKLDDDAGHIVKVQHKKHRGTRKNHHENEHSILPNNPLNPRDPNFNVNFRWLTKFFACYSVPHNIDFILELNRKIRKGAFAHVSAIRTLSLFWIAFGHCYSVISLNGTVKDLQQAEQMTTQFNFQFVLTGAYAVDTFFFLSGFFLAVVGLGSVETAFRDVMRKRRNWFFRSLGLVFAYLYALTKRWLRLFSAYILIGFLYYFGTPLLVHGPNVPALIDSIVHGYQGGCTKYWWTNLLFINNLVPSGSPMECMPWTWYLANDFQFFAVGLGLLFIRSWSKTAFRGLSGLLLFASYVCGWVVNSQYNLHVSSLSLSTASQNTHGNWLDPVLANNEYYVHPSCRYPPHLIGLLLGIGMMHPKFRNFIYSKINGLNRNLKSILIQFGHVVALGVLFSFVCLNYSANRKNAIPWDRTFELCFLTFGRSFWALGIAWFTVSLAFAGRPSPKDNQMAVADKIKSDLLHSPPTPVFDDSVSLTLKSSLSTTTFIIFSHLNYSFYLAHPIIQQLLYSTYPVAYQFTLTYGFFYAFCFIACSLLFSTFVFVLAEVPHAKVFKLIGL